MVRICSISDLVKVCKNSDIFPKRNVAKGPSQWLQYVCPTIKNNLPARELTSLVMTVCTLVSTSSNGHD